MTRAAREWREALRSLERRAKAGRPHSRREAVHELKQKGVKLHDQRLSEWLADDADEVKIPRHSDPDIEAGLWALIKLWSDWAGDRPPSRAYWMSLLEAAQPAGRSSGANERQARSATQPCQVRPVRQWSARRLGVHPAITGRLDGSDGAGFVLPTFVPRPHDTELIKYLEAAADGTETALVIMRGNSCTGKTRSAHQAVNAAVPDWDLLFPVDTESLLAALAAEVVGPRTVLWLNEAQNFLFGPTGEAAAAALLHRLDQPGPNIMVATLWPDYHRDILATPSPGHPDPHPHARALVSQGRRIDVPDEFTESDLRAVRTLAGTDASLAAAQEARTRAITQVLAAGPDLVDHYEHPSGPHGTYGQALITAAIDARILGHGPALPLALLQAAAPGYLTDDQRAAADPDTWFTHALDYARARVKNVAAALQDVAHPTGMGAVPGVVHLTGFLDQHGRRVRRMTTPPREFWDAAARHAWSPEDLTALATAAETRWRLRHAALLYRQAAEFGHEEASQQLAKMLAETQRWVHPVEAEAAHPWIPTLEELVRAVRTPVEDVSTETNETEHLYAGVLNLAKDQGRRTPSTFEDLRVIATGGCCVHDLDAAEIRWLVQTAADAGIPWALSWLAKARERAGDRAEAEKLFQSAADRGDTFALGDLARLREEAGDRASAERLAWSAADAGCGWVLRGLALTRRTEASWSQILRYGLEADGSVSDPW